MKSPVSVVMSYSGIARPRGSIASTFKFAFVLTASPSIERLRVIAGSVMEKAQVLGEAAADADVAQAIFVVHALPFGVEIETPCACVNPAEDLRVRVRDPKHGRAARPRSVEDAGEKARAPLTAGQERPLGRRPDSIDQ